MKPEPTVFVVDDDDAVCRFLRGLIGSVGLNVKTYASAREFLAAGKPSRPGCLLLDIRMPGMSGLELQKELASRNIRIPIIILTGHGDVQLAVHAMKAGAFDFVEKPFNNELLLDSIQKAVAENIQAGAAHARQDEIADCMQRLTPREHYVLERVVAGDTNKAIAHRLNISEKTIEIHRANMMAKMQAGSLADLVRMVALQEIRLRGNP